MELITIAGILILDQITKAVIQFYMVPYQSIRVIEGFFNITYVLNKGAAFGIMSQTNSSLRTPFFIVITLSAIGMLSYLMATTDKKETTLRTAYSMIIAGAAGNFIDRIFLGEVRDFLDVYWNTYHWPAFNVADSSICIGTGCLIMALYFVKDSDNKKGLDNIT